MLVAWLCKGEVIFDLWTFSCLVQSWSSRARKKPGKIGHNNWMTELVPLQVAQAQYESLTGKVWEMKLRTDFIWRNRYIFCHTKVTRIFCLGHLLFLCKSFGGGGSEYEFVTQSSLLATFCAPGLLLTRRTRVLLSGRICLHFIEKLNHIRSKSRCIYM